MMLKKDEIPRYRKKATKSVAKSRHKHDYIECILHDEVNNVYMHSEYCSICDKIGETKIFETELDDNGRSVTISNERLLEKYNHLEVLKIRDYLKDRTIKRD